MLSRQEQNDIYNEQLQRNAVAGQARDTCHKVNPTMQAKAPRPGHEAFASQAIETLVMNWQTDIKNEIIRAREQGQREGREDMQAKVQDLEKRNAALNQEFVVYQQRVQSTVREYLWAYHPCAFINGL